MNKSKLINDRMFRAYVSLSAEEVTQKDLFEILSVFADIKDPNQLFNQYRKYDELLGEDIDQLSRRSDGGYALASLVKLIRDSVGMIMAKNRSDAMGDGIPSSVQTEKDLLISSHARRVSRFLSAVSKENVHRLCIRLAQKRYDPMRETVWFTCLDGNNRLLGEHCLGKGDFGNSALNIRKLLTVALKLDAAALIVAHNHPDGNPMPSKSDFEVTEQLNRLCSCLDINLIDHIIVVPDKYVSIMKPRLHSSDENNDTSDKRNIEGETDIFSGIQADDFSNVIGEWKTGSKTDSKRSSTDNDVSDNQACIFADTDDFLSVDEDLESALKNYEDLPIDESVMGNVGWLPKEADEFGRKDLSDDFSAEGEPDCGNIRAAEAFKRLTEEDIYRDI